jgi:hypothetical protein
VNTGNVPQQQQPQPFLLRVRRALDHPEYPWQLRYLGVPELGNKKINQDQKEPIPTLITCFSSFLQEIRINQLF